MPTNPPSLNEQYGLTHYIQHDIDDKTKKCKKCHQHISKLIGESKLCRVIGPEEVAQFRDYDER